MIEIRYTRSSNFPTKAWKKRELTSVGSTLGFFDGLRVGEPEGLDEGSEL